MHLLLAEGHCLQACQPPPVHVDSMASAGGGALFAAFSAPFWVAGVQLGKQAFGASFQSERLELGWAKTPGIRKRWRLAARLPAVRGGTVDWNGQPGVRSSPHFCPPIWALLTGTANQMQDHFLPSFPNLGACLLEPSDTALLADILRLRRTPRQPPYPLLRRDVLTSPYHPTLACLSNSD